ncbi:MAG: hypothetical protein JWQ27_2222 [Ferruginibacter sp.]|nr:hypothetical protein [Ferruginibacter sp.]
MKKISLILLVAAVALASCTKNTFEATERSGIEGKTLVKIGMFSMTTVLGNQLIYNNGERISGVFASPYPYPGGGYNTGGGTGGDYFALTPGVNKFEFYSTNTGTANLISKIFETTQTLEAEKKYTIYITDTAANETAILAPDNGVAPADSGKANIRFINLIPNAAAVDFYQNNTLLKSNIKYKEFTEFFDIPAGTTDSFSIRIAGSAPGPALTATAYYRLAINTNRRILSMLSRGYIGAVDANRMPKVSVAVNQ